MIRLKVIGEPLDVAAKLKTNRPLTVGQTLACGSEDAMRKFAQEHPSLVELVVDAPAHQPTSNKMLNKGKKTKAK